MVYFFVGTWCLTTATRTAKVWKNFSLVHDLKGHQQSVWAVKIVEEDTYLTGVFYSTLLLAG